MERLQVYVFGEKIHGFVGGAVLFTALSETLAVPKFADAADARRTAERVAGEAGHSLYLDAQGLAAEAPEQAGDERGLYLLAANSPGCLQVTLVETGLNSTLEFSGDEGVAVTVIAGNEPAPRGGGRPLRPARLGRRTPPTPAALPVPSAGYRYDPHERLAGVLRHLEGRLGVHDALLLFEGEEPHQGRVRRVNHILAALDDVRTARAEFRRRLR